MSIVHYNMQCRLRHGKTPADWLKVNEEIAAWSRQQPGFRFRSLSETEDGKWMLDVYWDSRAAAEAAEEKFRLEMLGAAMPFIDPTSFTFGYSQAHQVLQG